MEEKARKSFSFFRSFYEAAGKFKEKKKQADFLMAICDYALNGNENELSGEVGLAFTLVKPILDKSRARAKAGTAGGLKNKKNAGESELNQKQTESKTEANASKIEANGKQTESKTQANEKQTESNPLLRNRSKEIGEGVRNKEKGIRNTETEANESNDGGGGFSDDALELAKLWEERFGTVSSFRVTTLQDLIDDYGKDVAVYAIKEAHHQGNSNWNYIKTIARNETIRREQRGTNRSGDGTGNTELSDPYLQQLHEQAKRNGNVV